jgi:hypothetical protein
MGIRFYCPNGHKLNVKDFQAGRRGICPYCETRIQIPMESTRLSRKELRRRGLTADPAFPKGVAIEEVTLEGHDDDEDQVVEEEPQAPDAQPAGESAAGSSDQPDRRAEEAASTREADSPAAAEPGSSASVAGGRAGPAWRRAGEASAAQSPQPAPSTEPPEPPPLPGQPPDPLAEAGDAVWYVRPPTGGQFGPAGPMVMRKWLDEHRVSADSLVWREGWDDWRKAGDVFIELKPSPAPVGAPAVPSLAATRRVRPRRVNRTQNALIIASLVVAVLALVLVFVIVVVMN